MQGSSSKIVQKTALKGVKLENSPFFEDLGHFVETFDNKLGNFFETCASGLVSSSGAFRSFLTEIFQSHKNSLKM